MSSANFPHFVLSGHVIFPDSLCDKPNQWQDGSQPEIGRELRAILKPKGTKKFAPIEVAGSIEFLESGAIGAVLVRTVMKVQRGSCVFAGPESIEGSIALFRDAGGEWNLEWMATLDDTLPPGDSPGGSRYFANHYLRMAEHSSEWRRDGAERAIAAQGETSIALALRAQAGLEEKAFAAAETDASRAIELASGDAERLRALGIRGRARLELPALAAAVEDLRSALALCNGDAHLCCTLGDALERSGDPEAALESYGRALALDPMCRAALLARAKTARSLKRWDSAVEDLDRLIGSAGQEVPAAFLERGLCHHHNGALMEAVSDLKIARSLGLRSAIDALAQIDRERALRPRPRAGDKKQ